MMGSNCVRKQTYLEYVIDLEGGLDAKSFAFHVHSLNQQISEAGSDLDYDDAYMVEARKDEIIFRVGPLRG